MGRFTCYLLILMIALVPLLNGCSSKVESKKEANDENLIGFSDWYKSEKYGRDIIDVLNFDNRTRKINVTTICFDEKNNSIPSGDSEILTMPANSRWPWVPVCPEGITSYTVNMSTAD
jgi:hypothetical protein